MTHNAAVCTRAQLTCDECDRPKCRRCGRCKHRRPGGAPGTWVYYCPRLRCRLRGVLP